MEEHKGSRKEHQVYEDNNTKLLLCLILHKLQKYEVLHISN